MLHKTDISVMQSFYTAFIWLFG